MIYIASDHAGFKLKEKVKKFLGKKKIGFVDLGAREFDRNDDYPNYAFRVARKVRGTKNKGILICGTGQGMCIAANKVRGVVAAPVWSLATARHAKEHLNADIICLGARFGNERDVGRIVSAWLNSRFKGGRHLRRLNKVRKLK